MKILNSGAVYQKGRGGGGGGGRLREPKSGLEYFVGAT